MLDVLAKDHGDDVGAAGSGTGLEDESQPDTDDHAAEKRQDEGGRGIGGHGIVGKRDQGCIAIDFLP